MVTRRAGSTKLVAWLVAAIALLIGAYQSSRRNAPSTTDASPRVERREVPPAAERHTDGTPRSEAGDSEARTTGKGKQYDFSAIRDDEERAVAREILALIDRGGPFRYRQDGVVFQNRESHLPRQPRGYYREYTVPTPGAKTRGARRIVRGTNGETYYTNDHYRSFTRLDR